ncbi:hypothetical protein F2Q70_00038723 [Brassica cretica]|uniref:Uncharacterized protein n=2 Tax=Brassica cretica TaxID=69181 RepID=A0A8S9K3G3_BRACR|nr:hypothetical protein F2Q70_00038723 [Brassica cretica]KAF2617486.1 hypothetical protein F2Q68_00039391 [Brassica cretica]KAF3498998.1 hypothetical protein DY000_02052976 [Brassica cretica]
MGCPSAQNLAEASRKRDTRTNAALEAETKKATSPSMEERCAYCGGQCFFSSNASSSGPWRFFSGVCRKDGCSRGVMNSCREEGFEVFFGVLVFG